MALTYHNNNSISNVTSFAQVPSGSPVLLSTATASSSAYIEFTSGIDSTYQVYKFEFINIHPQTDNVGFQFNMSTDNGSNYNVTKTSTAFRAYNYENNSAAGLDYLPDQDLAQSTSFQGIGDGVATGADNDQSISGNLILFNPASTIFVKHFLIMADECHQVDVAIQFYGAGYANTTSAINAIRFKMTSGNIDDGTIKMYGLK